MARGEVVLNEPIYLGMPVLEYSQQHMYHFFYKAMKPFYGDRVSLIYTDSDTLVLNVETDDRFNGYPNYAQRMFFFKKKQWLISGLSRWWSYGRRSSIET